MSEASANAAQPARLCPRCGAHGTTDDCSACGIATIAIPGGADDQGSLIGKVLAGRYEVKAVLGHGGMGTVYRCEQAMVERPVAIKAMLAESAVDADSVRNRRSEDGLDMMIE